MRTEWNKVTNGKNTASHLPCNPVPSDARGRALQEDSDGMGARLAARNKRLAGIETADKAGDAGMCFATSKLPGSGARLWTAETCLRFGGGRLRPMVRSSAPGSA